MSGRQPSSLLGAAQTVSGTTVALKHLLAYAIAMGWLWANSGDITKLPRTLVASQELLLSLLSDFAGWLLVMTKFNKTTQAEMLHFKPGGGSIREYVGKVKDWIIRLFQPPLDYTFDDTPLTSFYSRLLSNITARSLAANDDSGNVAREENALYVETLVSTLFPFYLAPDLSNTTGPGFVLATLFTYLGSGRAGEFGLLTWKNTEFQGGFRPLQMYWRETKTSSLYSLPFYPSMDTMELDIFRALGTYWAVKGCNRTFNEGTDPERVFNEAAERKLANFAKWISSAVTAVCPHHTGEPSLSLSLPPLFLFLFLANKSPVFLFFSLFPLPSFSLTNSPLSFSFSLSLPFLFLSLSSLSLSLSSLSHLSLQLPA